MGKPVKMGAFGLTLGTLFMALLALSWCGALACDGLLPVSSAMSPNLNARRPDPLLRQALDSSIDVLRTIRKETSFFVCGQSYSAERLLRGFELFAREVDDARDDEGVRRFLMEHFTICQSAGDDGAGTMLVTGYFEPLLSGSMQRKAPYLYPLYAPPPDLVVARDGEQGESVVGRMRDGVLLPYWTRREIEQGKMPPGGEIVYLDDPVDRFILHVQGSGRIRLPDGSMRRVRYAANNGRPYRSIGGVLVQRGAMRLEEVTLPSIISYLRAHPDEMQEIFFANERYVFFSLQDAKTGDEGEGPPGSMGRPLTAGHSIAVDTACFPAPLFGFLETELPEFDEKGEFLRWRKEGRFVVNQDSGAAIKGAGRVDLFLGHGKTAETTAGLMKQPGRLYFFLPID